MGAVERIPAAMPDGADGNLRVALTSAKNVGLSDLPRGELQIYLEKGSGGIKVLKKLLAKAVSDNAVFQRADDLCKALNVNAIAGAAGGLARIQAVSWIGGGSVLATELEERYPWLTGYIKKGKVPTEALKARATPPFQPGTGPPSRNGQPTPPHPVTSTDAASMPSSPSARPSPASPAARVAAQVAVALATLESDRERALRDIQQAVNHQLTKTLGSGHSLLQIGAPNWEAQSKIFPAFSGLAQSRYPADPADKIVAELVKSVAETATAAAKAVEAKSSKLRTDICGKLDSGETGKVPDSAELNFLGLVATKCRSSYAYSLGSTAFMPRTVATQYAYATKQLELPKGSVLIGDAQLVAVIKRHQGHWAFGLSERIKGFVVPDGIETLSLLNESTPGHARVDPLGVFREAFDSFICEYFAIGRQLADTPTDRFVFVGKTTRAAVDSFVSAVEEWSKRRDIYINEICANNPTEHDVKNPASQRACAVFLSAPFQPYAAFDELHADMAPGAPGDTSEKVHLKPATEPLEGPLPPQTFSV